MALFKTRLDDFNSTVGKSPKKSPFRHGLHKVSWAIKAAGELEQFRKSIAPHVDNLELLLLQRNLYVICYFGMGIALIITET